MVVCLHVFAGVFAGVSAVVFIVLVFLAVWVSCAGVFGGVVMVWWCFLRGCFWCCDDGVSVGVFCWRFCWCLF